MSPCVCDPLPCSALTQHTWPGNSLNDVVTVNIYTACARAVNYHGYDGSTLEVVGRGLGAGDGMRMQSGRTSSPATSRIFCETPSALMQPTALQLQSFRHVPLASAEEPGRFLGSLETLTDVVPKPTATTLTSPDASSSIKKKYSCRPDQHHLHTTARKTIKSCRS